MTVLKHYNLTGFEAPFETTERNNMYMYIYIYMENMDNAIY